MRKKFLLMLTLLILALGGGNLFAQVAKVGNTEYATIDEAIDNWTNGTTLTLLADVTLSDVIKLSSTEHHILDLGTYTMTAKTGTGALGFLSNKDAIEIVNNGRSSAGYALDINADATNPGGITTATSKAVVKTTGKSGVQDRPIIRFYNGVFNAGYIVSHSGSNGTNCPQFWFYGGEFNGTISTNRSLNQFYGGTFNGQLWMSVDSSAYTLIAGGTFSNLSNNQGSTLNSAKFTIGSAKGVYDKEVYIDDNGNYVIAAAEPAEGIEADVAKTPGTNDYLAYSKVATEGKLNYTDVKVALEKNNSTSAEVTVYVEELDMTGINFKGTIVVPEGNDITITNAPSTLKVELADGTVLTPDENGTVATKLKVATLAELQAALAAENELPIIITETIVIPEGETVVLDLNGKTVTRQDEANQYALRNLGDLTIKDTKGNGSINARGIYNGYGDGGANVATAKITVVNGTINAKGTNGGGAIFNYGTANVNGGTFTSIGGYSLNNQAGASMTIADGVTANNGIYASGATLVVNGGEISGNRSGCHVLYAWNSTVTINGGEFYNNNSGNSTTMAAGTTELTITGGTFGIKDGRVPGNGNTWTSCLTDTQNSATMTVNGGTFNGGFRVQGGTTMTINGGSFNDCCGSGYNIYGTAVVKGGTFTDAAAKNFAKSKLAEGYELNADGTVTAIPVAEVNGTKYTSIEDALAAATAGSEIKLLANIGGDIIVPANVTLNGNGCVISGGIFAEGDITFAGVTTAADFDAKVVNTAINIPAGASLQLTGSARLVIGHGATFNITGTIEDAKTADKATLVPSLKIAAGASITGNGVTFNVNNAYIVSNANTTSKNSNANGTLDFNINNSIWEQTGVLAFYVPTSGKDPVVNFELKNSVLTTTSHLVFSVTKGEIVIDNSLVNQGTSRQIENRSTMTIKNGSVVNGAVATSSNAINPGTIIVENATYAVTGEFSGAAEGTGKIIIKKDANVSVGSIKAGANVTVDATDMVAGDEINFTANLSQFTGTLSVINNDDLEAKIVDGKIVLALKPEAMIGETPYETLAAAFAAAQNGDVIIINRNVTSFPVINKAVTFKGGKENAAVEINYALSQNFTAIDGTVRFENLTFNKPLFTEQGGTKPGLTIEFEGCNFNVNSEAGYGILIGTSYSNSVVKGLMVNNCNFKYVGDVFKGGYMLYVQCVNEVTITNNTIDGNNLYRGAIHLGDATEHATVATVSNNTIKNFCRGVMMGNRVAGSSATISGNTFDNINYSDKDQKPAQECAPIFIHGNATAEALHIVLTNNAITNCTNPMIYSDDTDLVADYVTEFTDNTVNGTAVEFGKSCYNAPNELPVVAKIGDKGYQSLQKAIDKVQNGETITLIADITENVTLTEKTGLYYTIDGDGKTMTGTITVSSLSDTEDNRRITVKNIEFVDSADANVDFISSVNTNHYPRLTIEGCTFTGSGNDGDVAVRLKSSHSVVIKDCTGTGLHSFLQNTSGWNLTIEKVTVTDSKSGLALGTVQGVTVKGCEIAVDGYGIRMDAQYNNNAVIESNKVNAFIPVVVRKAEVNSNITFQGTNTFEESNTNGIWCAIGTSEYEENGKLPTAATAMVNVTLNDTGLDLKGIYGYTFSGEGTEEKPYLINNINDLIVFRNNVNAGNNYSGKYVKLTANINLNNEEWEPIGYMGKNFIGNFDGGDHTISNLKVTKELANASENNGVGLFGRVDSPATIKNLTIENATIKGSLYVGAVVGYAYTGNSIENVTVKGDIAIDAWWYAGVIGGNGYMSLVNNCHVIGNAGSYIKGNNGSYIGGIWGFRGEGANNITNCTVTNLAVEGVDRVGGISGMAHYGNTISGCSVNKVTIAATDEDATTVGIIAGACQGTVSEPSTITYSEVVDVTVTIDGNNVDASIYGTNIDGTTPYTNYVARIGGMQYITLADALDAANNNDIIEFLPLATNNVVAMNGKVVGNKTVTITGTANVDWSKGWFFVGRGGEGNGKVIFNKANLTSKSNSSSYGFNISGKKNGSSDTNNGEVEIIESTIELDYLINKGNITLDESTLTVKNGFAVGGRPASETENGKDATATITLNNGSKLVVNKHNGMGLGYEAIGIMNVNSGSTFECTQDFLVTANGTMNVDGGIVTTKVKITNNGVINVSGESTLNIATLTGEEINFLDGAIINNSTIGGNVFVAGFVTFRGDNTFNMLYDYGTLTDYYKTTAPMKWTVEEGASVTLTDKARYGLGYGDNVTVYGNIEDALTARETLTEADLSLFMHGLVAQESNGWNCNSALNIENAYVVIGSNNSFGNKPGNYGGDYTFNIKNSVVDASRITFYEALSTSTFTFEGSDVKMGTFMTRDADSKFILKNSKVLSTTTTNGNDEGNYNAGGLTLVNSSLTYSATLSNTGVITVDATSQLTAPAISGAGKITIDAADFVIGGGDVQVVTANMNGFTGTINVVNNNYVTAEITETGIVIKENELEGEGTVDNPYVLETLTELELFRNKVNAGDNYAGKYVKLTANVDLSATRSANNWEPIGTTACPFKGIFDGDNKVISNLVVEGGSYVGLFGKTVGATINNVTINNANVKGTSYVGAIVGMGYTGTINNCHVTDTIQIEGNYMVGGISGHGYAIINNSSVIATANSNSYVKGVYSDANLEGDNVGGIVGHCGENNNLEGNTVKNITVSGTRKVGGIVGIANMGTNIDACVVENVTIETTATEEYANDNIKTMSIGALIGQYQNNGSNGTVTNSTVKNVTFNNVNGVTVDVGPITGGTRGTTVVIEPTGVTASNNDIYMSTIIGRNNSYLMNAVAEIGGVKYYSLQEAINKVGDGETITLLSDVNVTTPAYGQNALNYSRAINSTIDLNGKTLSANTGNSVFRFNIADSGATSDVTVKMMNGTVVAGADTWCAVMAAGISADVKAIFNLEDITINGSKAGDLAVKSWDNAVVNANNVTIETTKGAGGFYAVGGEIVLNNCTVNQKGLHTAPYLSMAFAVSTEGKMTINSGTYSSEPTAASEGYNQGTSHGSWVGGVMNSGGTLIINGGTFSNDNYGDNSLATAARGLIFADTKGIVEVNGGTFNALKSIFDFQNNLGGTSPVITVKGGEYNADPEKVTSYGSIVIPDDYEVKNPTNGTWVVKQVSGTQTREFASAGWYWFSTYINLEGADGLKDLQDALVDENGDCVGKQIKGQDGFTQYFSGYNAWSPGLPAITTAEMYMVNVSAPVTVELTGKFVDYENRNITLNPGWNWIGYPVRETVAIENAFAAPFTPSDGDIIKAKSGGVSQYYKVAGGWFPSFDLVPGHGYKYLSVNPTTTGFCYTTENNSRGIANDNVIAENRWTPAASEFAENMVVIAMLNINGELADENYEVAAFANGVCRGSARPIYNEKLGKHILFMTINGEEVEELTFKCYDVNNGTEYELSNRVNYSNDAILGSIDEPYMFNMNFLNIEESSLDMINIYPNPTTTDRAINLQATCDNVEVFNALGVKVAEYQNVDTIDALETAGVYVIRVTINGETRNCRLVVK